MVLAHQKFLTQNSFVCNLNVKNQAQKIVAAVTLVSAQIEKECLLRSNLFYYE